MATEYRVSEAGVKDGIGLMRAQEHRNLEDAVKDVKGRQGKIESSMARGNAPTVTEVHAIEMKDGVRQARLLTEAEKKTMSRISAEFTEVAERGASKALGAVAHGANKFGAVGKLAGAAVAGTMAIAGGANASEVGTAALNGALPGAGTLASATKIEAGQLKIGEGKSKGLLCQAFGEVTGAVSGVAAGLGVGAATSVTGPGAVVLGAAAGIATEAVVTPVATAGCNAFVKKFGL